MNEYQRSLNRMPAEFRRKTNDSNILKWNRLYDQTREDRVKNHRDLEEAEVLAKTYEAFVFLEDKSNDKFYFSTLEGRNYINVKTARAYFVSICRQSDPDIAGQVITVWHNKTWLSLKDAYPLLKDNQ